MLAPCEPPGRQGALADTSGQRGTPPARRSHTSGRTQCPCRCEKSWQVPEGQSPPAPAPLRSCCPRSGGRAESGTQRPPARTPASICRGRSSGEAPGFTLKQLISKTSRRMSHGLRCWPQPCPSRGLSVVSILGLASDSHRSFRTLSRSRPRQRAGMRVPCEGDPELCIPAHPEVLGLLARRGHELTGYSRPC